MPIELNHTIVAAADAEFSALWLAEMLGLPDPRPLGLFLSNDGHFLEVITRPYGSGG